VVAGTSNPIFNQSFFLNIPDESHILPRFLLVDVFDQAQLGADALLGRCRVPLCLLTHVAGNADTEMLECWVKLTRDNTVNQGQLRFQMGFEMADRQQINFNIPLPIFSRYPLSNPYYRTQLYSQIGSGGELFPPNENILVEVEMVVASVGSDQVQGALVLTNYRLFFEPYLNQITPGYLSELDTVAVLEKIPLLAIDNVYVELPVAHTTASVPGNAPIVSVTHLNPNILTIDCRSGGTIKFALVGNADTRAVRSPNTLSNSVFQEIAEEIRWRQAERSFAFGGEVYYTDACVWSVRADRASFAAEAVDVLATAPPPPPTPPPSSTLSEGSIESLTYFSLEAEYLRMGIGNTDRNCPGSKWRITHVNEDYKLCDTYPALLVVPASFPDQSVLTASRSRSNYRFPVLTWRPSAHVPHMSCSLSRSAQPMAGLANLGIGGNSSKERDSDRLLLDIRHTSCVVESSDTTGRRYSAGAQQHTPTLQVFDARPKINAQANALMGKGYELEDHINSLPSLDRGLNVTLQFCDIPNIHAMRDSIEKLCNVVVWERGNPEYLMLLHRSGWLAHLSLLLTASSRISGALEAGAPCLVNCRYNKEIELIYCHYYLFLLGESEIRTSKIVKKTNCYLFQPNTESPNFLYSAILSALTFLYNLFEPLEANI
jgi:hypothetical protein